MGQAGRERRQPDPVVVMAQGLRRMRSFRLGDITRGFENFANPSAAGMLESLGHTESERVETMTAMLRNSSQADIEALGVIFGLAMARLAEEERADSPALDEQPRPGSQRRRREGQGAAERRRREGQGAAERRRERRHRS